MLCFVYLTSLESFSIVFYDSGSGVFCGIQPLILWHNIRICYILYIYLDIAASTSITLCVCLDILGWELTRATHLAPNWSYPTKNNPVVLMKFLVKGLFLVALKLMEIFFSCILEFEALCTTNDASYIEMLKSQFWHLTILKTL